MNGRWTLKIWSGKAAYLNEVSHAAQRLIDAGELLPEDLERILAQSARRNAPALRQRSRRAATAPCGAHRLQRSEAVCLG